MRRGAYRGTSREAWAEAMAAPVTRMSTKRKKRDNPEDWLSAALNSWLDLPEIKIRGVAFHVPNEQVSKAQAGRNKWIGVKPGVADWIFTGPPLVAVELKIGNRKPTDKQKVWGKALEETSSACLASDYHIEEVIDLFAPRYVVENSLAGAVAALRGSRLLLAPVFPAQVEETIEKVRRWYAVHEGREIP